MPIHSSVLVILGNCGVPSDKRGYPRGGLGVFENWGFVAGIAQLLPYILD